MTIRRPLRLSETDPTFLPNSKLQRRMTAASSVACCIGMKRSNGRPSVRT
uniref:Uncharacterized protein n=1 Tax=Arundo donax TaxID=35708 RepID=A0A0A9GHW3_ARUDO